MKSKLVSVGILAIVLAVSLRGVRAQAPASQPSQRNASESGSSEKAGVDSENSGEGATKDAPAPQTQDNAKEEDGKDKKQENDEPEKNKQKEQDEAEESVKRPTIPTVPPNKDELDAKPDEHGRVRFHFHGQKWHDFLEWLAEAGGYSLDWEELPAGYVSIMTHRFYSIEEARDMVNRLLLERGYTTVLQNEILSVLKLKNLDPSLIPRVEEEELLDLYRYDFAKVTFQLPEDLEAGKFAEDIKLLLSPHARVHPLVATNRLLVVDAVVNLREVSRVVNGEHAALRSKVAPHEFEIKYVRADYVADQVMIVLGLDPSSRRTPQELQVEQQRLQLFMQMQQKGKDVAKYLRQDKGPQVFIAVNKRRNTLIANAPEKELKVISRTVELLDVPGDGAELQARPAGTARMEKYQLVTMSPQSVVTALEQIGELDPKTQLKTDSEAKVVFAFATEDDHDKIRAVIDSLDGSGRHFEVIRLRRLPALAVAASVHKLMVGEQEQDDSRRYSYYSWRSRDEEPEKPNEGFRVDADVDNNRLILWANEAEIAEVRDLLKKLGELPDERGDTSTYRILPAAGTDQVETLLNEIRKLWPNVGNNSLQIDSEAPKQPQGDLEDSAMASPRTHAVARTNLTKGTRLATAAKTPRPIAKTQSQSARPNTGSFRDKDGDAIPALKDVSSIASPISITVRQNGQLVLSSRDTVALDRMEELINQLASSSLAYPVFYLQHASASLVTLNLEEYFEDETEVDEEENWWRAWSGLGFKESGTRGTGLGTRKNIRFIYDIDTNSILVVNATPEQLQIVRDLVEMYDKPPSDESFSARRLKLFELEYARAEQVAATIKEVYRDLLSSKDKEFDRPGEEKRQESQSRQVYRIFGGGNDEDKKPTKVKASFAGALSIGVDPATNTLIVSAQEEWMASISEMITQLDQRAEPIAPAFYVHRVKPGTSSKSLYSALSEITGDDTLKTGPAEDSEKQPNEPPQQPGKENPTVPPYRY